MDLNNIKDHIKDFELDFDQNEVWNNIQKEQNKGRRRIFFWMSSLLGGLILIVGLFHLVDGSTASNVGSAGVEVGQLAYTNEKSVSSTSILDVQDEDGSSLSSTTFAIGEIEQTKVVQNLQQEKSVELEIRSINESNKLVVKEAGNIPISVRGNNNISTKKNMLYSSSQNLIDDGIQTSFSTSSSTVSNEKNSTEVVGVYTLTNLSKVLVSSESSDSKSLSVSKEEKIVSQFISQPAKRKAIVVESLMGHTSIKSLVYDNTLDNIDLDNLIIPAKTEPLKESKKQIFAINTIAEYGFLVRDVALGEEGLSSFALEQREKTETAMDHMILGVNLSMPIGKIFYISSGVEYQRMTEKIEFSESALRPLRQDDLPVGSLNSQGFVISKSSSVYYNHLDFINVPLEVGIRLSQSRFSQFASIGTSINISTSGRQLYRNEFQELVDNTDSIKKNFNNSYVLKAGISYSLLSNLDWSLHASYRYLPNVSARTSNFEQSYQSYMLGTGIAYQF